MSNKLWDAWGNSVFIVSNEIRFVLINTKMIFYKIGNFCVIIEDTRDDCQFPEQKYSYS